MKLKLYRNVHNISLYKNDVCFLLLLMYFKSFHWLVMGKMKIGIIKLPSCCGYFGKSFSEMFIE